MDEVTNAPFPHGETFGGEAVLRTERGDLALHVFYCKFELDSGKWKAAFLAEGELPTDIFGAGDTPRDAFEQLVSRHTLLNGGVATPLLQRILPSLRTYFYPDGYLARHPVGNEEIIAGDDVSDWRPRG